MSDAPACPGAGLGEGDGIGEGVGDGDVPPALVPPHCSRGSEAATMRIEISRVRMRADTAGLIPL